MYIVPGTLFLFFRIKKGCSYFQIDVSFFMGYFRLFLNVLSREDLKDEMD